MNFMSIGSSSAYFAAIPNTAAYGCEEVVPHQATNHIFFSCMVEGALTSRECLQCRQMIVTIGRWHFLPRFGHLLGLGGGQRPLPR